MLILDVYNILHASTKTGGVWRRLSVGDLRELVGSSRWRSEQVVMVMDGTGGRPPDRTLRRSVDAGIDLPPGGSGVVEVHARAGGSGPDADAVIEALLEREDQLGRGRLTLVVSTDKRIRAAAAGARARSMTSEEFLRAIADDVRKRHERAADEQGGRPDFAQDGGMDAGRTAYWLGEFGLGEQSSAPGAAEGAGRQECGREVNPDDVDMGEILRRGPKPVREGDDEDDEPKAGSKGRR